jgi:parallel beta-helix repeat protein
MQRTRRIRPGLLFAAAAIALPASAGATSGTMWIDSDQTLAEDHSGSIIIDANNVTLNCNHHRVTPGGEFSNGIIVIGLNDVRVVNCKVSGFFENITVFDSHNVSLQGNEVTDADAGILVRGGAFLTITGNVVTGNGDGLDINECSQVFISDNRVSGNRDEGIDMDSVSDAYIENNPLIGGNGSDGLDIESSNLIRITNNVITGNPRWGVDLQQSTNCTIQNNDLRANGGPIRVEGGSGHTTEPNTTS